MSLIKDDPRDLLLIDKLIDIVIKWRVVNGLHGHEQKVEFAVSDRVSTQT